MRAPCARQFAKKSRIEFLGFIRLSQQGPNRQTADPVGRAFIGNGEAPTSSASSIPLYIAAISNRTRARNHHHTRS